jgi:hypothetical protein
MPWNPKASLNERFDGSLAACNRLPEPPANGDGDSHRANFCGESGP